MSPAEIQGRTNRKRIRSLVLASGTVGMRISEIMAATGLGDFSVGKHLRALGEMGVIERSMPTGCTVRWGAPGIEEAYRAERDREARRRAARQERISLSDLSEREAETWASSAPVRFVVPAHKAKPLGKVGPASVFDLGRQVP